MDKVAGFIVKHNKPIVIIFLILTAIGAVLSFLVPVNYNLEDYLPKDSKSTIGIKIMEEEFTEDFPSASIMITNDNILEILECKEKIASLDGVSSLMWLDDAVGKDVLLSTPLEFLDQDIVEQYYKEGKALFSLAIRPGDEVRVVEELYEIIGEDNSLSGSSVNKAVIQDISSTETLNAMIILLPVVIGVLLLTTSSWLEPLLFLITMGVAIGLNMGSNVIFSDISFVTKTVSPILQMAVSLDYAIFLMHSFKEYREEYDAPTAMKKAPTLSTDANSLTKRLSGGFYRKARVELTAFPVGAVKKFTVYADGTNATVPGVGATLKLSIAGTYANHSGYLDSAADGGTGIIPLHAVPAGTDGDTYNILAVITGLMTAVT